MDAPVIAHRFCGLPLYFEPADNGVEAHLICVCPLHGEIPMEEITLQGEPDAGRANS